MACGGRVGQDAQRVGRDRHHSLTPLGLSQYRLAKDISVAAGRINEIVHGKRGISADTAIRLARYFGTSERFWLNLQAQYDLDIEHDRRGNRLDTKVSARAS